MTAGVSAFTHRESRAAFNSWLEVTIAIARRVLALRKAAGGWMYKARAAAFRQLAACNETRLEETARRALASMLHQKLYAGFNGWLGNRQRGAHADSQLRRAGDVRRFANCDCAHG